MAGTQAQSREAQALLLPGGGPDVITSAFVAFALAATTGAPVALSVTFPDQVNPNFYNVMSCRGAVRQRTRFRVDKKGSPLTKNGSVVFRCDGPMTTQIHRIPFEPDYFHDTEWSFAFETADGQQVLTGYGAKVMTPPEQGLRFYVREGYLEP